MGFGPGPDGPSRNDGLTVETIGFFASFFMAGATVRPDRGALRDLQKAPQPDPLPTNGARENSAALIQSTRNFPHLFRAGSRNVLSCLHEHRRAQTSHDARGVLCLGPDP